MSSACSNLGTRRFGLTLLRMACTRLRRPSWPQHCTTVTHYSVAPADAARDLARNQGLPNISGLMRDLNEIRKSEAYGDVAMPGRLDPENVAREIEEYVDRVSHQMAT